MSDRVCPSCHGTKYSPVGMGKCVTCGGRGFVPTPEVSLVTKSNLTVVDEGAVYGMQGTRRIYFLSDGSITWKRPE